MGTHLVPWINLEMVIRLVAAGVAGGVIGWERRPGFPVTLLAWTFQASSGWPYFLAAGGFLVVAGAVRHGSSDISG